ncbi:MAG: hypothetical protein WBG92_17715, partial [Thiohalocapsa sp.]
MANVLDGVIRQLTPPLLLHLVRASRQKAARLLGSGQIVGAEQGPDWYDQSFEAHEHWRSHYTDSGYYFTWTVIADRMMRAKTAAVLDIGCGSGQL